MSAGTLSLTNASTAVTGTNTTFTADLAAGDFIVTTVDGVTYTLPVLSVDSDTGATLVSNYTGPTTSAAAWSAVPRATLNQITAALVAQTTEAMRGLNADKANWQQVFSGTGTITVTLPDGSTYSGPAWNSLTAALDDKADNSSLGTAAALDVGTTANTVAAGDDYRLTTINGKTGGVISGDITLPLNGGVSRNLVFTTLSAGEGIKAYATQAPFSDGSSRPVLTLSSIGGRKSVINAEGGVICRSGISALDPTFNSYFVNWTGSQATLYIDNFLLGSITTQAVSDKELKEQVEYRTDTNAAASEVKQWRVASFRYKARGIAPKSDEKLGFIANDLVLVSPECVKGEGLKEGFDENNPEGAYYLDPIAMIAKLTLAMQEQQKQISELQLLVKQFSSGS